MTAAKSTAISKEAQEILAQVDAAYRRNELSMQLYAARQAQGWSREELAERAGVSKATISRMEQQGVGWASLHTLSALVRALGLRLEIAVK